MKHLNKFILVILIIFIIFIIFIKNNTLEGLTNPIIFPVNLCSKVTTENNCQTNWQARDYFKNNNIDTSALPGNPCSWNLTTTNPNGICQNSTFASGWDYTFTGPALT